MLEGFVFGLCFGVFFVFLVWATRGASVKKLWRRSTGWCVRVNGSHDYTMIQFSTPFGCVPSHEECIHCGKKQQEDSDA